MSDNKKNHLKALKELDNSERVNKKKVDGSQFYLNCDALDILELITKKMEWNVDVSINSCITYYFINIDKIDWELFNKFELSSCEEVIAQLSIKNENRIEDFTKNHENRELLKSFIVSA
ncbi:hypothetical protein AB4374_16220, partial [Vibrio splendidus]